MQQPYSTDSLDVSALSCSLFLVSVVVIASVKALGELAGKQQRSSKRAETSRPLNLQPAVCSSAKSFRVCGFAKLRSSVP